VIGPYGFGLVRAPETIVTVSELGVVLMLFLIGLELELSRLLALRRAIFGLALQLQFFEGSESMDHHDSGSDDWWCVG